ncbi:MAG: hypothetical protein LBL82_01125 [Oscillospiraceae bacterium]|jgi:hypothetical protein|nr:hypothetical protein [Oscillospiraceae bacterium]
MSDIESNTNIQTKNTLEKIKDKLVIMSQEEQYAVLRFIKNIKKYSLNND